MHNDIPHDPLTLLDGWRDSGADRADPVRFRFIETMAQRASGYSGEAGRLLDARVARLVAEYGAMLARDAGASDEVASPEAQSQPHSALAELAALRERLGQHTQPATGAITSHTHANANANAQAHTPNALIPQRAAPVEPELADYFRDTWARVSVDRQMRQSQAGVPENAGPLNTNHLVHRSLSLMREVSPGYLEQFLSYVDALSWLEGMHPISLVPERKARAKSGKTGSGIV
ncbi:DUF2894 family protein [Cupriavidus metallidurans]|jgi:hypothetical protein|uniref:DUF2894 domain-containing protein n=1 Tax=Cupriavidus TaxID=106589 RepID=UPI00049390DE|nr:DUF2894 domain-containing protein [Cupriavidus metallidurans]AVA34212.1 DUF2894 domain-containing protein [Cupriavidus metallidurans]KWW34932.1 hypothetical protein AU374_03806 [Cupriavidus metallidurans]MDE4922140.1 DUF2894 domain-containing protein [Cupriavidus metallidurans]